MSEIEPPQKIRKSVCEDRISSLSDDLLIQILSCVPTKDAVATMFLSRRWRFVWTMLPRLDYQETKNTDLESKSVWWFLDQSMRLYNATVLERLRIKLGPQCPVDVDVVNWLSKAVDRRVRRLVFQLLWKSDPIKLPEILYTCKTLKKLTLSRNVVVDVQCPAFLPSLQKLNLLSVRYKDEDSHVRLLSGCPLLEYLEVLRFVGVDDNVRNFTVKVPTLRSLIYTQYYQEDEDRDEEDTDEDDIDIGEVIDIFEDMDGSLVIDTPALVYLEITDFMASTCSIENMPHLAEAFINVQFELNGNFLRSLSSIRQLSLYLSNPVAPWYKAVNYSRLTQCSIFLFDTGLCESLVLLLSSCPKLKSFKVECESDIIDQEIDHVPHVGNQPSPVPECLSSHLKMFELSGYTGREDEKELVRYIVKNSKCLKEAGIKPKSSLSAQEKQKTLEELKYMLKVSTEVRLSSDRMCLSVFF